VITKRTTINDVARLAGVSIKTVSRVFNREPHVRPETRDKVVAAAETLNYRPNLSARQLASNLTFVIGMLYDNPNSDYVTGVQYGSLQVCRENDYNLLIHPCRADAPELMTEVRGLHRQVDGFILLQPVSDIEAICRFMLDQNVACVRVSQRPFEWFPWISVGDSEAADEVTEHLLGLGHRRIGFIIGHPEHGSSYDRLAGYRSALERHGVEFDEALVRQGLFDYESGYACARELFDLNPRPTAIFASNDPMAMGVLSAAHEIKLDVPHELSIAGFDDSPLARHAWPPLTTVRQPITDVARLATEILMEELQGRSEVKPDQRLQAELVVRSSTAAPE
jgi:LacI family transcriptional regulator